MPNTLRSILVILITTLLFSCATVQRAVAVKKPRIVAKEYVEACAPPDESYYMRELNAKVFRHRNCLKVKDLLSVVWPGEMTKASKDGAAMLAISFAYHLTRKHPGTKYTVAPLGTDTLVHEGITHNMAFYEIRHRGRK